VHARQAKGPGNLINFLYRRSTLNLLSKRINKNHLAVWSPTCTETLISVRGFLHHFHPVPCFSTQQGARRSVLLYSRTHGAGTLSARPRLFNSVQSKHAQCRQCSLYLSFFHTVHRVHQWSMKQILEYCLSKHGNTRAEKDSQRKTDTLSTRALLPSGICTHAPLWIIVVKPTRFWSNSC
jgi:hypothetical protein